MTMNMRMSRWSMNILTPTTNTTSTHMISSGGATVPTFICTSILLCVTVIRISRTFTIGMGIESDNG